ncbi:MAG: hypothetical protein HY649_04365 [Acidobacteria bacterium]|nr:hypothetical protein [Acidobacteriota bacterium]
MNGKYSSLRLAIALVLITLLVASPSAAENASIGDGAVGKRGSSPWVPDLKAALAKELARSRPTSLANLAAVHALNRLGAADMARISGGQDTAEETKQVQNKGWWGRNWPWVVAPALAVGVGVAVAAAAGAFHHDNGDEGRMMWSSP